MEFIKILKFDEKGLIPAVIQDYRDGQVLMVAWMNGESIRKSLKTGRTCFWSRSRKEFWIKGERSGNIQLIKEILFDCDADTLLIKVKQVGGACHTGYRSCFHIKVNKNGNSKITGKRVFDPKKIYSQKELR
jgi:phosphoribosyl-AMP cyclohydrolase